MTNLSPVWLPGISHFSYCDKQRGIRLLVKYKAANKFNHKFTVKTFFLLCPMFVLHFKTNCVGGIQSTGWHINFVNTFVQSLAALAVFAVVTTNYRSMNSLLVMCVYVSVLDKKENCARLAVCARINSKDVTNKWKPVKKYYKRSCGSRFQHSVCCK